MASSGTIGKLTGSYSTTYTITWSLLSQSTANNTSKIRLTATFRTGNTTTIASDYSTFRMDGTTVYSGSYSKTGSGNIFTRTKDITVSHNNDGTFPGRTVSYSTNDYIMGSQSGSGSISGVPSIPRQALITNAPNFNDEENPTITYSNKAGSIVTSLQACISLDGTTDDIEYRDIPIDGSSYTFNLTEAERNVLRNATTTSNTRNVVFMIKTILGGNTFYSQANATLSIVNANPIFTASNISYLDTNASVVAITQNNQDIVRNQSTLQISYTGATGVKGATISSYEISFNTDIRTKSTPSTIYYGTINLSQNSPLTIKAIDSRGNSTIATKMITILDWINPSAIISLGRVNNFEDSTKLKVEVTISSVNEKNAIQRIRYRYKKTSEETYSGYTIINNNVEYTLTLAKEYSWNIQIEINDKFGTTIYNTTVAKGVPILFVDPNKRAIGINCFPEEDESLYLNGEKVTPGGGTSTDVQINGTSITSGGVANIVTESAYDSSTNKIATMGDIPTPIQGVSLSIATTTVKSSYSTTESSATATDVIGVQIRSIPGDGSKRVTTFIPITLVTTSDVTYQISDDVNWVCFSLRKSTSGAKTTVYTKGTSRKDSAGTLQVYMVRLTATLN